MKKRCLYCYQVVEGSNLDFHPLCSKKIFGQSVAPELDFSESDAEKLAATIIRSQSAVTGVQAKLSLVLDRKPSNAQPARFTIVGLWGAYILKPPSVQYLELPEVEDVTMHLAQIAKLKTVPHSLIRLQSGNLAYLTKRIDRLDGLKIPMEDMCQLTEKMTEHKYLGSYELIAKTIRRYSAVAQYDVISFYELVLFSFLTGNADMHLKNFSLYRASDAGYTLAPAYDLVATALVNPDDDEDLALTLNGKKKKIRMSDFKAAFDAAQINDKQQSNMFKKMVKAKPLWFDFIDCSFLSAKNKELFRGLIENRFKRLIN